MGRFWKWSVRLARTSCCCCQSLFGTRSSNHCGNLLRWSCSLLFNSLITCGAQSAGNQIIRESAGQKPSIQSDTRCVHNRSTGFGLPLLSHNFYQPTARSLPFSFYTCIVSRCRMQQLLINGLNSNSHKKMCVFLISQGSTLRYPGSTAK